MSGHSKWANIKHRKAAQDAKKANVFTKLAKDITIAARDGGDPETNFRLRLAVDKARSYNMPNDNVERAIKKGTGEDKDGAEIVEIVYEAYGPGQVAMLIKVATDNKNRTVSEIRTIFNKKGGKFVEGGAVSWQFENVGSLLVGADGKAQDEVEEAVIESGAKDYETEDDKYVVYTAPAELKSVKESLESAGLTIEDASLGFRAKNTTSIDDKTKEEYDRVWEALDENDDVVEVYDNLE